MTFHDGSPFDAEDVKASIELASGATKTTSVYAGFSVPTTVQIVNSSTVRLHTKTPFGGLFAALFQTQIASAADLAGPASARKKHPNGTGPFKLVSDELTKKTMEANPSYWRKPASIGTLTWEYVSDPQTRLNALLAGQAQAIDRVPPENLAIIQRTSKLALDSVQGLEAVNLWVHPDRTALWTQNASFRQAASWSIDRAALVEHLVMGKSAVAGSYVPRGPSTTETAVRPIPSTATRAKALLAAAGAADGGPEFELWVASGFLPAATNVVQAIANGFEQVGLKPKIVTSDVAGLVDDIFSKKGTGTMYHLSWSSNGDPFTALQPYGSPFVWSDGDKTIDALIKAGGASTKHAIRQAAYSKLQAYMWKKAPHIPLYNSDFSVGRAANLAGLHPLPNFSTYFYPASLT